MTDRPLSKDMTPGTRLRYGPDGKVATLDHRKDVSEHDTETPWFPGWWLTGNDGGLADYVIDDPDSPWEIVPHEGSGLPHGWMR